MTPDSLLQALKHDQVMLAELRQTDDVEGLEALLASHDERVRTYLFMAGDNADIGSLRALQQTHQDTLAALTRSRDEASSQLRSLRTSQTASNAYQSSRSY